MSERIAVSAPDAAKMIGLSRNQFDSAVQDGRIPPPIQIGATKRWLISDIEAYKARPILTLPRRPKSVPLGPGTHHLYRHFDKDGRLLYVGISLSAVARLADHKSESHWFWQIARIEVKAYRTRASALKAEKISIQREKPLHNIVHARRDAA